MISEWWIYTDCDSLGNLPTRDFYYHESFWFLFIRWTFIVLCTGYYPGTSQKFIPYEMTWYEANLFPLVWSEANIFIYDTSKCLGTFLWTQSSPLSCWMFDRKWLRFFKIDRVFWNVLFDIDTKLKRHRLMSHGNNRPSNEFIIELWARRASVAFSSTVSYRFSSNIIPKEKLKQSSLFF